MTITAFDKSNLKTLREEIQSALDEVAQRHGIKIQMKGITYDPTGASFRAPLEAQAGAFEDVTRNQALSFAKSFCGVDASQPSTNPRTPGAVLKEFRAKSRKRPWVYEQGGTMYVTTDEGVRAMWPAAEAKAPIASPL